MPPSGPPAPTSWLSPGGTAAAVLVAAAVAAGTGWAGLGVLLAFFVPASLLTPGGGRRTALQVLANGGVAAAAAVLTLQHSGWRFAFAGALAAAAADTWSTEIGVRGKELPRLITTGRPVPAGTSGGVTWLGSAGGVAGALVVAACAALLGLVTVAQVPLLAGAGVVGGVFDSLLGATVQARYRCGRCGEIGERPRHGCGGKAVLAAGLPWLTNDGVNLAATVCGAFLAWVPVAAGAAALA